MTPRDGRKGRAVGERRGRDGGRTGETTAPARRRTGRPTRRRVLASVGAAATVALAGCAGGDADTGDGETTNDGGGEATSDSDDDGGSTDAPTDAGSNGGDAPEDEGLTLYRFDGPERYEYETVDDMVHDGATGTLVVDVVEADGVEATVDLSYEAGEYVAEDSVSGPVDEMMTSLGLSSAGGYLFSMGQVGIQNYLETTSEVSVGDVWEVGTTERVRTEITGTETVAGVDGYQFVTTLIDSEDGPGQYSRGVYSPELQLLAEMVIEDAEGNVVLSKRLVDYERR